MRVAFEPLALDHYSEWPFKSKRLFEKLRKLIAETSRTPFEGTGKPEPLKHSKQGFWSRRIDQEHRLVYKVEGDMLVIISCMYHYAE